jgi:alanine racemase
MAAALRLSIDRAALIANWRALGDQAGVPAAAAIKADGYGLGAQGVAATLAAAGCRAFLVSTWEEALALGVTPGAIVVLHGFLEGDGAAAAALAAARPVLNTPAQVAAWASAFPGRPADLMVETGMNRLGLAPAELAQALAAVPVDTVHGHLACADQPGHPLTDRQLAAFRAVAAASPGARHSLANSAGICLGTAFSFDLVRPGLALYGGRPRPGVTMRRVVTPEARVIQLRSVSAGATVGYGAEWTAPRESRIAIVNIGYADGVLRATAPHLAALAGGIRCPHAGRVSMDMTAFDVTEGEVAEGDWLALDWDLPALAAASGISQYELLTALGRRGARVWA